MYRGFNNISLHKLLVLDTNSRGTRGHTCKLVKTWCTRDITRAHSFPQKIWPNSTAPFAKFRGSPRQILGIPWLTAAAHSRVLLL